MKNDDLKEMRRDITALIDDVKYHSDSLTDLERLPVIQLKVILAKINKLTEKTTILLHYIELQGKLSEAHKADSSATKQEVITPEPIIEKPLVADETKETAPELPEIKPEAPEEKPPIVELKKPVKTQNIEEKLKKIVIRDLMSAIGINEKYLFASVLFKGNTETFFKSIEQINQLVSAAELNAYLEGLKKTYSWDMENDTVKNFMELVLRKFDQS
jgi:hypothetical protein